MSGPIRWLARRIWWGMLWLMRRPTVRRMQRASFRMFPERMRARQRQRFISGERFARRIGLQLMIAVLWALLLGILLAVSLLASTYFIEQVVIPLNY